MEEIELPADDDVNIVASPELSSSVTDAVCHDLDSTRIGLRFIKCKFVDMNALFTGAEIAARKSQKFKCQQLIFRRVHPLLDMARER
jgi:hypothetical protein